MAKIATVKKTITCTMQLASNCSKKAGIWPEETFYKANNEFYAVGRTTICKHCIKEYVYDGDKLDIKKFISILRVFNMPFYEDVMKQALDNDSETVGTYFRLIQLNFSNYTWVNGDINETTTEIKDGLTELRLKWGENFNNAQLQWLEQNYLEWTTNHKCDQLSIRRLVQMICVKELEIRMARENGQSTEKMESALLSLMNNSNLTAKSSVASSSESVKSLGSWIRDIEQNRPAEYFEDKKIYEDFDGIMDYFMRFILRPMKNLLTGSREFDKEFMIEEEEGE